MAAVASRTTITSVASPATVATQATTATMTTTTTATTTWSSAAWWLGLLLLHVANAFYYAGVTWFYRFLPFTNLAFQFRTYSIGIAESEYSNVALTHAVVAAVHVLYILVMVLSSLYARRPVFYPEMGHSLHNLLATVVPHAHFPSPSTSSYRGRLAKTLLGWLSWLVHVVWGRRGLFGVDHAYFDHLLVLREQVETVLQSYQANRMSQLPPRLGMIRVYVLLLVANCWSVAVLHRVYRYQPARRRMASLLCDAVLDTVSSMGISVLIFSKYAPQFTDKRFGFPFNHWFNDEWFTNLHQEFQLMLVVSWSDMATRLVFACGLLQCMDAIKDMLVVQPSAYGGSHGVLSPTSSTSSRVNSLAIIRTAVVPLPDPIQPTRGPKQSIASSAKELRPQSSSPQLWCWLERIVAFVLHTVGPYVFVLWGFAMLGVHLYAETSQHSDWPCKLRLRPWLSARPACSLVEIDCHQLRVSGTVESLDDAWRAFDPTLVARTMVRHCSALTIPVTFQHFHGITGLKIYNSTLVAWPLDAAVTSKSHAGLRALYFVRTTFANATLPAGLTSPQFPPKFRLFALSGTNLASLPDDLDRVWPPRLSLSLEASRFTSVPDVVLRLRPSLLSLSQNAITSIPTSVVEMPTLAVLMLCYTGLLELPRNVTNPSRILYVVLLEGTQISTLWSWMDPVIAKSLSYHKRFFNLHGSRFCSERQQLHQGRRSQFSGSATESSAALATVMNVSTPERLEFAQEAVACDTDFLSFFPLALEDAVSAISYTSTWK